MTIELCESTFLLVVSDDHASILHGYGDTGLQRFWGHEFDLLGSHDVTVVWYDLEKASGGLIVYLAVSMRYLFAFDIRPLRGCVDEFLGFRTLAALLTPSTGLLCHLGLATCLYELMQIERRTEPRLQRAAAAGQIEDKH